MAKHEKAQNYVNATRIILILSANPIGTTRLRLNEEVREVEEGLRRAKHRDKFEIKSKLAVNLRDLRRALLEYEPEIVHFTGHGNKEGLLVEDDLGMAARISSEALAGLFELCSDHVECVILSSCYSAYQANAIKKHIDNVIGMKKEIMDKAAIEFAVGFYDALGAGKEVEQAFKFGCNAILQIFPDLPQHLIPVLKKRKKLIDKKEKKGSEKKIKNESTVCRTRQSRSNEVNKEKSAIGVEAVKTYEFLFGRDKEINDVISLLIDKNKPGLINIYGLGGVGKTSLVREMVESKHPEGVVWLSAKKHYFEGDELFRHPLAESITLQQVYRKIAAKPGRIYLEELEGLKEKAMRIQWLQNLLAKEKLWVVVDNFETIDEDFKQFLAETRLLFSGGPSRMIITSRFGLKQYPFVYNYKLNGLSENDTLALFSHELVKSSEGAAISIDKKKLKNIYLATAGLPLAIKLIAARIRSSNIEALNYILERLQNIRFTNKEEIYERFYKFIYLDTWDSLSDDARNLLVLMSTFAPGEAISVSYLERIIAAAEDSPSWQKDFWKAFEEIKKYSLVDTRKNDPIVFSLHPLTQSFVKAEILQMDEHDEFKKT